VSRQQGLFDLRNYLRHYVEEGKEAASVAEIGVCIAEEVLGADIFRTLAASRSQRTLRIQLPGATEEDNHLAAALARVPWEMARAAADQPTLGERNLLVRVVHDMAAPATQPLALGKDECLRVTSKPNEFLRSIGETPPDEKDAPAPTGGLPKGAPPKVAVRP